MNEHTTDVGVFDLVNSFCGEGSSIVGWCQYVEDDEQTDDAYIFDYAEWTLVGAEYVDGVAFVPGSGENNSQATTPPTEAVTEPAGIVPAQYLTQWATFPDEEGIISYFIPNADGSAQLFDNPYYVVYANEDYMLLAKQPDASIYESTRQLIFHENAFGIPAIEVQKLDPEGDDEPRTLDYFWRSTDLAQTEAVTLTDDNWELYLNNRLNDRYNSIDNMIRDNGDTTYFYFNFFALEGSWAEGTLIRNSYLHRSYMIGNQGYIENIPGYSYPSDQQVRLDNRSAEIRVSNIPDGIQNGRALEADYQGKTNRYYEQFSTPAHLENVTGVVYIPKGLDVTAWLAANE